MNVKAIEAITKALVPGDATVGGFEYGSPMPQDAVPMPHREENTGDGLQYEFHQNGVDYCFYGHREHGVLRILANVHCDFRGNLKYAKDCVNAAKRAVRKRLQEVPETGQLPSECDCPVCRFESRLHQCEGACLNGYHSVDLRRGLHRDAGTGELQFAFCSEGWHDHVQGWADHGTGAA